MVPNGDSVYLILSKRRCDPRLGRRRPGKRSAEPPAAAPPRLQAPPAPGGASTRIQLEAGARERPRKRIPGWLGPFMSSMLTVDVPMAVAERGAAKREAAAPKTERWLTAALAAAATLACILAGWLPLGVSIVAVFSVRWPSQLVRGPVHALAHAGGALGAAARLFPDGHRRRVVVDRRLRALQLPWWADWAAWNNERWITSLATWNTGLVAWILLLVQLRRSAKPARDWAWIHPLGCGAVGLAWLWPQAWDLTLIYLHPLMALWFLDREMGKGRPTWRKAYRRSLVLLPVLLADSCGGNCASSPSLPGEDALTVRRITAHAGADILQNVSSHLLVATHVFMELLHYGVWLVMIPLVSLRTAPWNIAQVPLARRSPSWRNALTFSLALGALVVVLFWAGFPWPITR